LLHFPGSPLGGEKKLQNPARITYSRPRFEMNASRNEVAFVTVVLSRSVLTSTRVIEGFIEFVITRPRG